MRNLSAKQLRVLTELRRFAERQGHMPSHRQLAGELGLAHATIRQHLDALKRKGWLQSDGTAHGLRFVGTDRPLSGGVSVPILGTIAAGKPIEALEREADPIVVPRTLVRGQAFALRVRGDSMVDDAILDGDLVIVRPQDDVEDGEIAVALLDDGTATLKHVYRENGKVRLQPANAAMAPLYVDSVRIQGKVLGVIRQYA